MCCVRDVFTHSSPSIYLEKNVFKQKCLASKMALFSIFSPNVFTIWLNGRQLESHVGFCIQPVAGSEVSCRDLCSLYTREQEFKRKTGAWCYENRFYVEGSLRGSYWGIPRGAPAIRWAPLCWVLGHRCPGAEGRRSQQTLSVQCVLSAECNHVINAGWDGGGRSGPSSWTLNESSRCITGQAEEGFLGWEGA